MKKITIFITFLSWFSTSQIFCGNWLKNVFIEKPADALAEKSELFRMNQQIKKNNDGIYIDDNEKPIPIFKNKYSYKVKNSGQPVQKNDQYNIDNYMNDFNKFLNALNNNTIFIIENEVVDKNNPDDSKIESEFNIKQTSDNKLVRPYTPINIANNINIPNKKAYGLVIGSYVLVIGAISVAIYKLISHIRKNKKTENLIVEVKPDLDPKIKEEIELLTNKFLNKKR